MKLFPFDFKMRLFWVLVNKKFICGQDCIGKNIKCEKFKVTNKDFQMIERILRRPIILSQNIIKIKNHIKFKTNSIAFKILEQRFYGKEKMEKFYYFFGYNDTKKNMDLYLDN